MASSLSQSNLTRPLSHLPLSLKSCSEIAHQMALTTAERNRRKRERKKKRKETSTTEENQPQDSTTATSNNSDPANKEIKEEDVEIEYVVEDPLALITEDDMTVLEEVKKFHQKAAIVLDETSDPSTNTKKVSFQEGEDEEFFEDSEVPQSKRKLRHLLRPSVAELKRRVRRPDLVEAHDVSADNPDFLIELKGVPGTVPVPRHWGRKRKYLQGKLGFEKPPFKLPDFIVNTGITALRDSVAQEEANMSARQMNRQRVAPKMGAIDVDYRTLYDAFFKHQTKPNNMTRFGDVYYEGKELESHRTLKAGLPLSKALREALGMQSDTTPPPWLLNMQRYGPPPSYPALKIPGLNAPLPSKACQYGYHPGGWGKPPMDAYGRPAFGGNPFDPPGSSTRVEEEKETNGVPLVTSDGKTLSRKPWGALPMGVIGDDEESEETGSEMDESSVEGSDEGEEEQDVTQEADADEVPVTQGISRAALDLRQQMASESADDSQPKQLYHVIDQKKVEGEAQSGQVFTSEIKYVLPGTGEEGKPGSLPNTKGSKEESKSSKKGGDEDEDDEDDLEKNFKF